MHGDSQELLDEWVVEIEGRIVNSDISHARRASMDSNNEEYPSIFGKWQCWDDFGASFIPETIKWHLVSCMTHCFGLNVKSFLEYMQGKVDLAWSYYHGVNGKFHTAENNKRFIEHLLVSSCFLMFVMVHLSEEEYRKVINDQMDYQTSFPTGLMRKDIGKISTFLNENKLKNQLFMLTMDYQIPWFVLQAVYTELSNIGKLLHTPIHKLALLCFPKYLRVHTSKVNGDTVPEGGFKHLLHIFHWSRSPQGKYQLVTSRPTKSIDRFHIPTATDLQLAQTIFVNDEGGSVDVSYSHNRRLSGEMQLTPWHLFQYSTKLYGSLLTFEWRYRDCGIPFTAYVACMACLLKREADVKVLRENGVIPSTTFDDKDVLRCVQELKTFIPEGLKMSTELVILEKKVMAHYQRSAYRVYGEFKRRYCSNPWITISVIGAILLFVLTFIQTIFSILSYKISILSYNKQ